MVKLSESNVYIRTKCSIETVKKLNLWGSYVDDISICAQMPMLEVLSLSKNEVTSLEGLQNCTKLRELYLRDNCLESLNELERLKELKELRVLWIDENPCTRDVDYREEIIRMLPQVTRLDDKEVTKEERDGKPEEHKISTSSAVTIVDTVAQPQIALFKDTSEEESSETSHSSVRDHYPLMNCHVSSCLSTPRKKLMTQSLYAPQDGDWSDFGIDEEPDVMSTSMYEPKKYRSVSVPRKRLPRTRSTSPAKELRLVKIMSAVTVLLDELDQDGLRHVADEALKRIKKHK